MRRAIASLVMCGGCFSEAPPKDDEAIAVDESSSSDGESSDGSSSGEPAADCMDAYNACEPACDDEGCTDPWAQCVAELFACDPARAAEYEECLDTVGDCYEQCPPCADGSCSLRNACINTCDGDCEIEPPTG